MIGDTVKIAGIGQERMAVLDEEKTVYEELSGGVDDLELGTSLVSSRAYCTWFGFRSGQQQQLIKNLSGGERNRVHIGRVVKSGANVLVLDEPTNDLDVETMRSLEEGLLNFAGTAVIVSHDRSFLNRLCTHIIGFEGDSRVHFFEGNFADYEEDRVKRLGPIATKRLAFAPVLVN